jgi:SOS response regulatory protein OraA/RecX
MVLRIELKKGDLKTLILYWDDEVWKHVAKSMFLKELQKIPAYVGWEEFLQIFAGIEERVGRRYALYLLSRQSLLSNELEAKLLAKGLSARAAKVVTGYCVQQGYIDDSSQIGRLVARELGKGRSARAVFLKLKQRGLESGILNNALCAAAHSDEAALKRWLEKNAKKIDRSDSVHMKKLMAKLIRRGFAPDLVFKMLSQEMDYN